MALLNQIITKKLLSQNVLLSGGPAVSPAKTLGLSQVKRGKRRKMCRPSYFRKQGLVERMGHTCIIDVSTEVT